MDLWSEEFCSLIRQHKTSRIMPPNAVAAQELNPENHLVGVAGNLLTKYRSSDRALRAKVKKPD